MLSEVIQCFVLNTNPCIMQGLSIYLKDFLTKIVHIWTRGGVVSATLGYITEMTLNSTFLVCSFVLIHHSFKFPDMILEEGQLTPFTPLGSAPE